MFLEKIQVENYRSIRNVGLTPCGAFNVLIGKNSAGKSNVLASIDAFFSSIKPHGINTNPDIGEQIYFFQKNIRLPISITATLRLSEDERSKLFADVSSERPQVRNLAESIEGNLRLRICVCIMPSPRKHACVRRIELLIKEENSHILLDVSDDAADELYNSTARLERANLSKDGLDRFIRQFDQADYNATQRSRSPREPGGGPPIDYFLRQYAGTDLSPDMMGQLVAALNAADNYNNFVSSLLKLSETSRAEIERLSNQPIAAAIKTFSGEEHVVPQYVKNLLQHLVQTKILHFRERRVPIGSEEAKRLLSLKVRRGGPEILTRIQSTVNELLGVEVDAFEGPPGRRGEQTAELDVDQFLIQVNGSGIREALRLILDTEFENPNIILVEEPEIHLHPGLETSIMRYLRDVSKHAQVFITTHSTNFLDTGNFENVFLVTKDKSTEVSILTMAEAEEKLPSELGIRLSSLFMYDQIVFVEGPSDEQIIREFAGTLDVNFGQLNVGFIQMRGVRNLGHYAAAEVVSFLTKRRVKLWFLVDQDEAAGVHFMRLKEDFGENARIHILRKREIENYLLSATANVRHLTARKRAEFNFKPPTEAEFGAQLEECAESLKSLTVWKRVRAATRRPIYPKDDRQSAPATLEEMKRRSKEMLEAMERTAQALVRSIDQVCDDGEKDTNAAWSRSKLDIVPGSALLDEVYKKYGLRYDKLRDGVSLASLIERDQIEWEIREFFESL